MIQFNLLPDLKIEYIKTQRLKHMITVISLGAIAFGVGVLLIMLAVSATQKKHLSDLDKDISVIKLELENTPDLKKILSVQHQLKTLPQLYEGRPAVDRLPTFLDQTTPTGIGLGQISIDYVANTFEISGTAKNFKRVNNYVDTLRYTKYKTSQETEATLFAFNQVVLTQFNVDSEETTFSLSFSFDPAIFKVSNVIELKVPKLVSTRAEVPSKDLFNGSVAPEAESGGQ